MIGSAFWSGALITTAAGVEFHSLPMLYLGYGLLGGVGWGFMYLTPVSLCVDDSRRLLFSSFQTRVSSNV
jgi:OFA family oxalate/formate antiporter-like MFS transporter